MGGFPSELRHRAARGSQSLDSSSVLLALYSSQCAPEDGKRQWTAGKLILNRRSILNLLSAREIIRRVNRAASSAVTVERLRQLHFSTPPPPSQPALR